MVKSRICLPAPKNELGKLLEQKNCFKLICGAGNENLDEVEKLVALYAKAGCHFFDLSASEDVLKAAQKGLDFAIPKDHQKSYHFCVSIGTKKDVHFNKAMINPDKCTGCGKCIEICPQNAIVRCEHAKMRRCLELVEKYCIGCLKCLKNCPHFAIEAIRGEDMEKRKGLEFVTRQRIQASTPLACIELHASDTDENETNEIWQCLNKKFEGMLSLCIGREKLSNEKVLSRVKSLVEKREPYTTIIQADGSPMSGGKDDFKTTLQAVAMAEVIQNENLPVYIIASGGTNSRTAELARICGVNIHGVAIGSYARKIVKDHIIREDFFENDKIFNEALKIAKNLVKSVK